MGHHVQVTMDELTNNVSSSFPSTPLHADSIYPLSRLNDTLILGDHGRADQQRILCHRSQVIDDVTIPHLILDVC